MSNNKDYSSIYTMEEFMLNSIAPLYFNMDEINQFNIGLFGYTTHTMADMGDDVSNMVSALHSEITPVTAKQPSTIYANAALYRMDDIYAKPAKLNILLMIGIDELLANLTKEKDTSYIKFDSNTVIDIDGIPFMLANDLVINVKAFKGEYKYIVRYDNVFSNDVADTSSSPYLRSIVVNTELGDMLCISCDVYQMYKIIEEDTLYSNCQFTTENDHLISEEYKNNNIKARKMKQDNIKQYYNYQLTDEENVKSMNDNGLTISIKTLRRWRKSNGIQREIGGDHKSNAYKIAKNQSIIS